MTGERIAGCLLLVGSVAALVAMLVLAISQGRHESAATVGIVLSGVSVIATATTPSATTATKQVSPYGHAPRVTRIETPVPSYTSVPATQPPATATTAPRGTLPTRESVAVAAAEAIDAGDLLILLVDHAPSLSLYRVAILDLARCESRYYLGAIGAAGELGLFQFMPSHFAEFGYDVEDFEDPVTQVLMLVALQARDGWRPWVTCGREAGLLPGPTTTASAVQTTEPKEGPGVIADTPTAEPWSYPERIDCEPADATVDDLEQELLELINLWRERQDNPAVQPLVILPPLQYSAEMRYDGIYIDMAPDTELPALDDLERGIYQRTMDCGYRLAAPWWRTPGWHREILLEGDGLNDLRVVMLQLQPYAESILHEAFRGIGIAHYTHEHGDLFPWGHWWVVTLASDLEWPQ